MPTSHCRKPVESHQIGRSHRARTLTVMLVLGAGFSLILYEHGAWWWYAPLAGLAIVLAHMMVLGVVVFVATRVIRRPRLYNFLVRVMTFGREGALRRRMLDLADLQPEDKVLDVGCGTGTLLLAAAERVGRSGALHGIEPAVEMVAHAQRKAKARRVSLEIVEGSADSLPYPPASFDRVFCTLVLHHLPGTMQGIAVREMRRVLRPGGRVVIVDQQRPRSRARALTAAVSLFTLLHSLSPSTRRFDLLDLEPLMTELGFQDITRHSFGSGALGALVGQLDPGTCS